jgi:hypothetical protein
MYRIDSLHPDRFVCEVCASTIGAISLDPGQVPLGALPSADASAERPELAEAIRAHEAACPHAGLCPGKEVEAHLLNGLADRC